VRVVAPAGPGLSASDEIEGISIERFRYAPRRYEKLAYTGNIGERRCIVLDCKTRPRRIPRFRFHSLCPGKTQLRARACSRALVVPQRCGWNVGERTRAYPPCDDTSRHRREVGSQGWSRQATLRARPQALRGRHNCPVSRWLRDETEVLVAGSSSNGCADAGGDESFFARLVARRTAPAFSSAG